LLLSFAAVTLSTKGTGADATDLSIIAAPVLVRC
jgi:hypothetical protein